jgi:RNase adaptor protein for sRNA GlmZ degradation
MPAQEHSGVADMWQKLLHPDYLIVLDAPNEVLRQRRPGIDLNDKVLAEERRRLAHAFAHANLTLDTSAMNENEIVQTILDWLAARDSSSLPQP